MELAPGAQVTETLRLVELLGEGGMGSVWVAEHTTLKNRVAVKFLYPELAAANPELVGRFKREATAAARIKSPHVVTVHDHGIATTGSPYIVMELLTGEDLGKRLEREGTLELDVLGEIIEQTARALSKAHEIGIVHRDVKPDNIFLVDEGDGKIHVKILDFGVAKQTGLQSRTVVTAAGTMLGTPAYMSPEQVMSGKDVDPRSDVWSLGVVAYHAMCGDIPFEGETLGALCVSITRGQVKPPGEVGTGIPPTVDRWMQRALALHRDERFPSAAELADGFSHAIRVSGGGTLLMPDDSGAHAAIVAQAAAAQAAAAAKAAGKVASPGHSLKQGVVVTPRGTQVIGDGGPISSQRASAMDAPVSNPSESLRGSIPKQKPYILVGSIVGALGLLMGIAIAVLLSSRATATRPGDDDAAEAQATIASAKAPTSGASVGSADAAVAASSGAAAKASATASVSATVGASAPMGANLSTASKPTRKAPVRRWQPPPRAQPPGFKDRGF